MLMGWAAKWRSICFDAKHCSGLSLLRSSPMAAWAKIGQTLSQVAGQRARPSEPRGNEGNGAERSSQCTRRIRIPGSPRFFGQIYRNVLILKDKFGGERDIHIGHQVPDLERRFSAEN